MMTSTSVAVLGAGSWGTAVAIHLARYGSKVKLWSRNIAHVNAMQRERCNARYLPGFEFPTAITVCAEIQDCVQDSKHIIIAVPSHGFNEILHSLPSTISGLSWLTKGIDHDTHRFLSELVKEYYGANFPLAVISGPSFAREVAQKLPTAIVVASNNASYSKKISALLHHDYLRVYQSKDICGVQLCGTVKNVLAIACGISDGLHFGANARAALITRGLAEMKRLGLKIGARATTFLGLAGVGDLVLTCTDDQSRNRRFGIMLGQGMSIGNAQAKIDQVIEGKNNTAQICALAKKHGIEMPICQEILALLQGKITANEVVSNLMTRPPRVE